MHCIHAYLNPTYVLELSDVSKCTSMGLVYQMYCGFSFEENVITVY